MEVDWMKVRYWSVQIGVLALACLLGFGSYFCYDSPAALQTDLKQALNLTQSEFMGLYAWYSWPNVFLCFLGGYLIDVLLGRRLGGITFSFFVLAGQAVLAVGVAKRSLLTMDLGRLIFGLGGETLAVVGNAYAVAWFSGSMLNLAFGLVLSVSRLGSTASLNILSPIFHSLNETKPAGTEESTVLAETMGIAGVACVFSFTIAVILAILDKQVKGDDCDEPVMNSQSESHSMPEESSGHPDNGQIEATDDETLLIPQSEEPVTFGDKIKHYCFATAEVLNFPIGAWLLFAICVFYYSSVFPLISQGVEFFVKWFGVSEAEARMLNSVVYTMSLPGSPIFGLIIDRTKHNVLWVLAAVALTTLAHALMACARWFSLTPWIPVMLLGTGYSMLACSLWPMVSFIVPKHRLGTAYGFMQAIQNLGLALTAMLSGVIVDRGGYGQLLMFFLSFQGLAMFAALALWKRHGANCTPIEGEM